MPILEQRQRPQVQPGLLRRLQPGAHQSRRQRASADHDHQGHQSARRRRRRGQSTQLYASIVTAGTHLAPSIRVAEAAKVIENTQRDLNIALMNELAMIFERMGIDTSDVLAAAGRSGTSCPSGPGLVGGHCIGVDPYYLTHKAQELGYHPEVILPGGGSTTAWAPTSPSRSSSSCSNAEWQLPEPDPRVGADVQGELP